MYSGVGKSGSPAPKPITGFPTAFNALALLSTANVADSAIAAIRFDTLDFSDAPMGGQSAIYA
jgi:hypothetical protein